MGAAGDGNRRDQVGGLEGESTGRDKWNGGDYSGAR